MMLRSREQIILFTILILFAIGLVSATPLKQDSKTVISSNKNQNVGNLANSYNELLNDVRWFFQRLEGFSTTALNVLPNVSMSGETRTFSEYTRLNFLYGLRHLFVGIREMSITMRNSVEAEHMRQFQYVIQATNIIHQALKTVKHWLSSMRALFAQLFRLYSHHLPEVLLGKCLGSYVASSYPESSFYEYPFLLLNEFFNAILESRGTTEDTVSPVEIEMEITDPENELLQTTTETVSVEQNEIPYEGRESLKAKGRVLADTDENYFMSFFNLGYIMDEDKEAVIESAVKYNSWKRCFKLYTAETIVRKLKGYFLETDEI